MAKSVQLKWAIWVYLSLTWISVAYAAENPLVAGIEAIPLKAVLYVFALSIVGGAAGTLTKLARPDIVVRNLPLEISKDVLTSLVAGLLAFFFTSWWDGFSFWPQAIAITVAGYGGSRILDMLLADGALPWLTTLLGRLSGRQPPTVPPREETPQ